MSTPLAVILEFPCRRAPPDGRIAHALPPLDPAEAFPLAHTSQADVANSDPMDASVISDLVRQ